MARWCLLVLLLLLPGCGETPTPPPVHDGPRIISLSPAITGTLEDVGLGHCLVGRSHWCRLKTRDPEEVPAVGDLHERHWEAMLRVRPTHVFFQSEGIETDKALINLAAQNGWTLRAWPLRTVDEVQQVLFDLPDTINLMSSESNQSLLVRCQTLSDELSKSMQATSLPKPCRVLVINDDLPPLAWGTDTYLGEMLASAGGENVVGSGGWKTLSIEELVRLQPDLVLIVAEQDTNQPPAIVSSSVTTIPEDQCRWLVHSQINFPGPHLAEVSFQMREILANR
ncbi:MAG: hypothetical protein VX527_03520 [Planctomycetota bacterium]|nr:hypothetical protein [Planctomycetota bacterium]